MRTRQGENCLFGQPDFPGQAVKGGQQPVQLALLGKKIVVKPRGLRVGKTADFVNHLSHRHALKLSLSSRLASAEAQEAQKGFLHYNTQESCFLGNILSGHHAQVVRYQRLQAILDPPSSILFGCGFAAL
jgi:hypothetical protein